VSKSALRKWHPGKLVILWAWCIILMVVCADWLHKDPGPMWGTVLIILFLLAPITLSVITWHWLSGREEEPSPSKPPD
jgi:hypothetical protein